MKITIAAVGRMKQGAKLELMESYIKRILCDVVIREVEEKKNLPPKELQKREGELLLKAIPAGAVKIILDENGKNITSREFAGKIQKWTDEGMRDIALIIGGADGHAQSVKDSADFTMSLGKLTWPHMLVRVMLCEQIYRAYSILSNHPYHRD